MPARSQRILQIHMCENFHLNAKWEWVVIWVLQVPSDFSGLIVLEVCCVLLSSQCLFVFSSGVNHNRQGGSFSRLRPLPAARPGCPVPPVVEGWHLEITSLPHSMGREQGWVYLRATPGFGVFWFIPPWLGLSSANLLYWEGFSGQLEIGMALLQTGQSALGWPLEGVRVWKLSRMYPDEKPPPFSLPTQWWCFATRCIHGTCWQYPPSQWG